MEEILKRLPIPLSVLYSRAQLGIRNFPTSLAFCQTSLFPEWMASMRQNTEALGDIWVTVPLGQLSSRSHSYSFISIGENAQPAPPTGLQFMNYNSWQGGGQLSHLDPYFSVSQLKKRWSHLDWGWKSQSAHLEPCKMPPHTKRDGGCILVADGDSNVRK